LSSLINTYAKGRFVEKCMLPLGTDSIVVVLIQNTGLPADTTLVNCQNLQAVWNAGAQEANFTNYQRMSLTGSSISITYATNTTPTEVTVSFAEQTWNAAGGAVNNTISKVALVYQPTSSSSDGQCLVLATLDYTGTTTGGAFIVTLGVLSDS
jgi:hypothetical protein